jgi:SMI1-KNR4 cell-wall
MSIEEIARQYDEVIGSIICVAQSPTNESIATIEEQLGILLPNDLIEFARASKNYGNWLASIGPDYESTTHIVNINSRLREEGKLPSNFIAINVGYDEDWDCIDMSTYEEKTGESLITCWAEGVPQRESELYGSFFDYIKSQVEFWSKNA